MSNLDYPISILCVKLSKLSQHRPASFEDAKKEANQLNGINRAINILRDEKRGDEVKEKRWKEKIKRIKIKGG